MGNVTIHNTTYQNAKVYFACGVSVDFQDWSASVKEEDWQLIRKSEGLWVFRYDDYKEGDVVLVVREVGLGDILFTTPGLRAMKEMGAKVYYKTDPRYIPLLIRNPYLDGVNADVQATRVVDLRKISMDMDYTENRSERALKEMFVNPEGRDKSLILEMTDGSKAYAEKWRIGSQKKVLVEIDASTGHRTYPHMQEVANQLAGKGYQVFLVTPYRRLESEVPGVINLTGQTSVEEFIGLANAVDYIIGNDSGAQYLGEVFKKPTLAIYGTIDPDLRTRYFRFIRTIYARTEGCACSPCNEALTCGSAPKCLKEIKPERVLEEFGKMLAAIKGAE